MSVGPLGVGPAGTRAGLAWGRLLRLSLAPSAAADVLCGLLLGGDGAFPAAERAWLLVPASLAVYHGGLALNDWADRRSDGATRPGRPIPSGRVPAGPALAVALLLLASSVALAAAVAPACGLWAAGLVALVVAYDLGGRGPWLGPLLLGACRAGNLGLGVLGAALVAEPVGAPPAAWLPCLLYGAYVVFASRLGRLEDDEDPRPLGSRPTRALLTAATCLLLVPAVAWLRGSGWVGVAGSGVLALAAAAGPLGFAMSRPGWTRADVGRHMGGLLRRLLVVTAAFSLSTWREAAPAPAIVATLAILAGYPLSFALRRVFPPT